MQRLTELTSIVCLSFCLSAKAEATQLPSECREAAGTIAIIDCLENQRDIQSKLLEYLELSLRITEIQTHLETVFTPPMPVSSKPQPPSESDLSAEQAAWFEQEIEVYAIAGGTDNLTAHVRLENREYRLQRGDSVRLAKIVDVLPRKVIFDVLTHRFEVGLASSTKLRESQPDE